MLHASETWPLTKTNLELSQVKARYLKYQRWNLSDIGLKHRNHKYDFFFFAKKLLEVKTHFSYINQNAVKDDF